MPSAIRGRLRHRFYRALEHDPRLWTSYRRWRDPDHPYVDDTSDVLVDGFYGSGNTFLRESIRYANPALQVASHGHSPAHVRRALQLGVPALVTVRDPAAAVVSIRSRLLDAERPASVVLDVPTLLGDYARFYDGLVPLVEDLVVATFQEVTSAVHVPLERLGLLSGTALAAPTAEEHNEVLARIDSWHRRTAPPDEQHLAARPDRRRADDRAIVEDQLREPANARLLAAARASRRRFLERWRASWTGSDAGLASIPHAHRASERRGPSNG